MPEDRIQNENKRVSPFEEMEEKESRMVTPDEDAMDTYDGEGYDEEPYEETETVQMERSARTKVEASDEMDEEDEEEEMDDGLGSPFFASVLGKVVLGIVALILMALAMLVMVYLLKKPTDDLLVPAHQEQSITTDNGSLPMGETDVQTPQLTAVPSSIIFTPNAIMTDEPKEEATAVPTSQPTSAPHPTTVPTAEPTPKELATELPIILSNTPTPSPTPTPTPTPSPSPVPTQTPTPAPTALPNLGKGEVNRDHVNLREKAASNAKIKKSVDKGELVTIHQMISDKTGKGWYYVTVDDLNESGWMRDYVVTTNKLETPTPTEKPTKEKGNADLPEVSEEAIGTGKINNESANLRKVMNGKVISQLKKGKCVEILEIKTDKNGKNWYLVKPEGSKTSGYVRDYLVTLDKDVQIALPTATPVVKKTSAPTQKDSVSGTSETAEGKTVIGTASTNRDANVRKDPKDGAKVLRTLSKGVALNILDMYESNHQIWYEVETQSGKTHGYVRDYVLNVKTIDKSYEAKPYPTK